MKRRFKISNLFLMALVGALLMSGCGNSKEDSEAQTDDDYTPVEVAIAKVDTIANEVSINGKVVANDEISVIPKVVGVVTNVNAKLGDVVKEGAVLFTIEKDDISKSVEQAANTIEIAKKGVAQAENGVNTANVNFQLNSEKIQDAQLNLERTKKLYDEGAVSKMQLEQAELGASEKNLDALQGQVNQAEISYQQALTQLRQAEISYEQVVNGLDNTVVKSPINGVVSSLNVKKGQIATNSQTAATIVNADSVYVQINVVEGMVNNLQVGQAVKVKIASASSEYISSTISYISPTADPRSQLYAIRVYLDDVNKDIRPGMNGEVKLNMDQVGSAIVVKADAVIDKDDRQLVYIVEDGVAVEKEVTTGLDTGDFIEIRSGINEGEKVIIEGQHYLENGEKVKVVRGE